MSSAVDTLASQVMQVLADKLVSAERAFDELTVRVKPQDLIQTCLTLRDHPNLAFKQLIDLCGADYRDYGEGTWDGPRFASVYHLLSLEKNQRLRLKVFAHDDDFPIIPSVISLWPCANWYEREAFDLYGIIFEGHPDLRRILTDYGFVGYPFRKDFPLIGNVEMRYDPDQQRVIYQPVSIEERELVPRVIREDSYSG